MPNSNDKYIGLWKLIPELSQYEEGHPPKSADYGIAISEGLATFDLIWTDYKDKTHTLKYGGPIDGTVNPHNGGKIEVSYTRVDAYRLDSSTYHNGFEAVYVHRKASDDGNLMVVMTVNSHEDEGSTRNFQVYQRA